MNMNYVLLEQSSESKQQVEIENAQNFRRSSSREVEEKPEEPDGVIAVRTKVLKIDNGEETKGY